MNGPEHSHSAEYLRQLQDSTTQELAQLGLGREGKPSYRSSHLHCDAGDALGSRRRVDEDNRCSQVVDSRQRS